MITIWYEPHAATLDKEADRASGWNDVTLSEVGKQQAIGLIERYRDRKIDAIFCSDLQRAVLTAVPLANDLHLPIHPDERLRECNYGSMTGLARELVQQERPRRVVEPYPDGESYTQCLDRMKPFFEQLRRDFEGKTVLIVGHMATHYGIEHFALSRSLEESMTEPRPPHHGWKYILSS